MESRTVTRRRFLIDAGAAATVVAVAADLAPSALATPPAGAGEETFFAARFETARGTREAVVRGLDGHVTAIRLDDDAFVSHGADGVVDSTAAFVSDEEIVVRGSPSDGVVAVSELQSMYWGVSGKLERDRTGYVLVTPSGQRVTTSSEVLRRRLGSTPELGAEYSATIWIHPRTNEAVALEVGRAS